MSLNLLQDEDKTRLSAMFFFAFSLFILILFHSLFGLILSFFFAWLGYGVIREQEYQRIVSVVTLYIMVFLGATFVLLFIFMPTNTSGAPGSSSPIISTEFLLVIFSLMTIIEIMLIRFLSSERIRNNWAK